MMFQPTPPSEKSGDSTAQEAKRASHSFNPRRPPRRAATLDRIYRQSGLCVSTHAALREERRQRACPTIRITASFNPRRPPRRAATQSSPPPLGAASVSTHAALREERRRSGRKNLDAVYGFNPRRPPRRAATFQFDYQMYRKLFQPTPPSEKSGD